ASARPRRNAAGEDERDAGPAQRDDGLLQARQHLAEVHLRPVLAHPERLTRPPGRVTGVCSASVLARMRKVPGSIRIAAAGDIHCGTDPRDRARVEAAFASLEPDLDLVLLAGDLTTIGEPDEARLLAEICERVPVPVFAVLGNHDWHANRTHDVVATLTRGGIQLLERGSVELDVRGTSVGIVGLKGFVGGFPDYTLPDFGEPLLRQLYAETSLDVEALDRELEAVADCDIRIVLMHYSPTTTTLE